jgi:WD40 repeat protein
VAAPIVVSRDGSILFLGFAGRGELLAPVTVQQRFSIIGEGAGNATVTAATLDARGTTCFAALSSGKLLRVDLKAARAAGSTSPASGSFVTVVTPSAHAGCVRRVVNSEGRLNCVVTVGDDGFMRGWDCSAAAKAHPTTVTTSSTSNDDASSSPSMLFEFLAHHHYAMAAAVNEHSPDLALSAGADRCTRLWRVPLLQASSSSSTGTPSGAADTSVSCVRVGEHRDTVSSVVWSGPWVYATCSQDGAVTVDQVSFQLRSQLLLAQ